MIIGFLSSLQQHEIQLIILLHEVCCVEVNDAIRLKAPITKDDASRRDLNTTPAQGCGMHQSLPVGRRVRRACTNTSLRHKSQNEEKQKS